MTKNPKLFFTRPSILTTEFQLSLFIFPCVFRWKSITETKAWPTPSTRSFFLLLVFQFHLDEFCLVLDAADFSLPTCPCPPFSVTSPF